MYQYCRMCKLSSFKGNFCNHWNRRTSASHGWCKEIILKDEFDEIEHKERLRKQYEYEKSLLERHGYKSMTNFEEWVNFKNTKVL